MNLLRPKVHSTLERSIFTLCLSPINKMTDKALDKALIYFDENKNDKQNKN